MEKICEGKIFDGPHSSNYDLLKATIVKIEVRHWKARKKLAT